MELRDQQAGPHLVGGVDREVYVTTAELLAGRAEETRLRSLAATQDVANHSGAEGRPQIAVDSHGTATIVWAVGVLGTAQVRRLAGDGTTLSSIQTLTTTGTGHQTGAVY